MSSHSLYRTVAFVLWRLGVTERTRNSPDWTDTLCQVGLIASLEIYLGIIAVCIPTLGPLFNAYVKPSLNRIGFMKSAKASGPGVKPSYLQTFGGSNSNKRSHGYSEFSESADRIVSRDGSMKLTPTLDGKVTSECVFTPVTETDTADHGGDGIHVQRDIEAIYQSRKGPYYNE